MRWLVGTMIVGAAISGCGRRGDTGASPDLPSPSASALGIGVEMGGCEDLVACANECDGGSSDRCRRLGVRYEFGKGVDRDPARATELYEKACAMDDPEGCISAGRMYEFHHGVPKDDTKAARFYERACNREDAVGCANLAIMLENGRGIPRDDARATMLFDQACARGSGLACQHAKALRASGEAGVRG